VKFLRKCCKGEGVRIVKSTAKSRVNLALQSGFTLTELVVVVAIIVVVAGLSIPNLTRAIDTSRIKGAAQTLAAAYQDARIRATQKDTSYQVLISPPGILPPQLCIDLDGDGTCSAGDPVTTFPRQVRLSNLGVPFPLNSNLLHFPAIATEQSGAPANSLTWNAMGLPCQRGSSTAPCTAVGWVQHLQLLRANGDVMYAAVTVSPTGRIKTWIFIPSGNGNGSWL
jgi:prepilin-type N-terminal cleavage/methylation domain-containing protein